jgi:hypothetical protein
LAYRDRWPSLVCQDSQSCGFNSKTPGTFSDTAMGARKFQEGFLQIELGGHSDSLLSLVLHSGGILRQKASLGGF